MSQQLPASILIETNGSRHKLRLAGEPSDLTELLYDVVRDSPNFRKLYLHTTTLLLAFDPVFRAELDQTQTDFICHQTPAQYHHANA